MKKQSNIIDFEYYYEKKFNDDMAKAVQELIDYSRDLCVPEFITNAKVAGSTSSGVTLFWYNGMRLTQSEIQEI